jgi:hypothetical protein
MVELTSWTPVGAGKLLEYCSDHASKQSLWDSDMFQRILAVGGKLVSLLLFIVSTLLSFHLKSW